MFVILVFPGGKRTTLQNEAILEPGIVYFVGAGPGHPGLITLRGVECLRKADVVLYDYLANARTLCHAPATAELICLGRHRRADVWSQQSINDELVRRAKLGQTVVRLKGGDPMIFGRAAEEITALNQAQVAFEIVPGVTTASAAGAYAGVTITDRRYASAVALVTGHEQLGKPDSALDYQSLATFPGTLVVYMGVRTAPQWSQALLDAGKPPETPVLMIRRCSWPDQQQIACTLKEVADQLSPYQKFPPPVVVIIGEAARANAEFDWFRHLPLLGKGVVVTRPAHQAEGMVSRLSELGANAIIQPAIRIREPDDWQLVDAAISQLESFDFVIFSSANGVHFFMRRLLALGYDVRKLGNAKLAVIGPRTAKTLREYSLNADIQPSTYRAEALVETLTNASSVSGKKLLLLRASRGREVLADELTAAGGHVQQVVVYQSDDVSQCSAEVEELWQSTLPNADLPIAGLPKAESENTESPIAELQEVTSDDRAKRTSPSIDWLTVTSSAIARSLSSMWGDRLHQVKLASISPITSQTLRELGYEPAAEATVYTTDGVIDAILTAETGKV